MRRITILLLVMLVVSRVEVLAQQMSEAYYRENPSWIDAEVWASEGDYRLLPTTYNAPFEQFALYGFSFIDYAFRGEPSTTFATHLGTIEIKSPLSRYADWGLIALLRRVPAERSIQWSNAPSRQHTTVRGEYFDTSPHNLPLTRKAEVRLSTRTYNFGGGYSAVGTLNNLWRYSLAAGGRWGRDCNIEGLFDSEEYLWFSGERQWEAKNSTEQRLQLALMVAPTLRSQRSWNTEEVFSLAGNKHYNSYWGYQEGKVRSQRVRRECVPALYASWNIDDRYILSNLNISTLLRAGRRSRSTLDWGQAPNPLPDYRAYLPSAQADSAVALKAEEVWRQGDVRYTQLDWKSLYRANSLSNTGALYALLDEREDVLSGVVDISAGMFGAESGRLGLKLSAHRSHNYTSPRDLLGAGSLGADFDLYDYTIAHYEALLYGSLLHRFEQGTELSIAAEAGGERVDYGAEHSGRKTQLTSPIFRSRIAITSPTSDIKTIGATLRFDTTPPYWGDRLGAYEGAVEKNPYATNIQTTDLNTWIDWDFGKVELFVTTYLLSQRGVSTVEHFWDDLSDQYAALLVGGLWQVATGCEASLTLRPAKGLTLTAHGSLGIARHLDNGKADIVAFDNGATIASEVELQTSWMTFSPSPTFATALVARYSTPRGWLLGAEWAYVANRWMEPSLLLRSDYILSRNLTPEERERCIQSFELGNAHSVGIFAWRKWGNLSISLSVRNLLNFTDAYSAGYQPSRLVVTERDYAVSYTPHEARYQYIYPCHAYLTIGYEF